MDVARVALTCPQRWWKKSPAWSDAQFRFHELELQLEQQIWTYLKVKYDLEKQATHFIT